MLAVIYMQLVRGLKGGAGRMDLCQVRAHIRENQQAKELHKAVVWFYFNFRFISVLKITCLTVGL